MHLIDTQTLELHEFFHAIPKYAILSHRWGHTEVTFQEMQLPRDKVSSKTGWKKVKDFCRTALFLGYRYAWIDTCCINKTDPTELAEAINSMFQWYKKSDICIVHLSDVFCSTFSETSNPEFESSRWFKRGWTLQELLAPEQVHFYSAGWTFLTTKVSCLTALSSITGITKSALENGNCLDQFSIAQKMSWVAGRETTKEEDMAYCLLGLFDVSMPLLYGEGPKAFIRLQEEIMRTSDDQSILVWTTSKGSELHSYCSALAPTPDCFASAADVERLISGGGANHFSFQRRHFSVTNSGIQITLPIVRSFDSRFWAVLDCHEAGIPLCVPLQATTEDGRRYRKAAGPRKLICELEGYSCHVQEIYLNGPDPRAKPVTELPTSFVAGRWSTKDLERCQILEYLGYPNSSRKNSISLYHLCDRDMVAFSIYSLLSSTLYSYHFNLGLEAILPFAVMVMLCYRGTQGSLVLHIRLFVFGIFSFAGLGPETISRNMTEFCCGEKSSGSTPKLEIESSRVRRCDSHRHDELLQTYGMQKLWGLWTNAGLVSVCCAVAWADAQISVGSWSRNTKAAIACCSSAWVFHLDVRCVCKLLKKRRWLRAFMFALMGTTIITRNVMAVIWN